MRILRKYFSLQISSFIKLYWYNTSVCLSNFHISIIIIFTVFVFITRCLMVDRWRILKAVSSRFYMELLMTKKMFGFSTVWNFADILSKSRMAFFKWLFASFYLNFPHANREKIDPWSYYECQTEPGKQKCPVSVKLWTVCLRHVIKNFTLVTNHVI